MDLYKVLGVKKTATPDEIRTAFRNLTKKWHPDKNPGNKKAHDKFIEIQMAYDVLSDPAKRQYYDETGAIPQSASAGDDETFSIIANLLNKAVADLNHAAGFERMFNHPAWMQQQSKSLNAAAIVTAMKNQLIKSITDGKAVIQNNMKQSYDYKVLADQFEGQEDTCIFDILMGQAKALEVENERVQEGINSLQRAFDRLKGFKFDDIAKKPVLASSSY